MDFIAIDFETANQHRTSACALGIAVVKNNQIVDEKSWLIRPIPFEFNSFNISIHGITENDVKNAPAFDQLWPEIKTYFENQIIVAHNASFDISVLRRTLEYYSIALPNIQILCTYRISQVAFPNAGSHRLNALCALMDIPLVHHDALSDARACAEMLCKWMIDNSLNSIGELKKHYNIKSGYLYGDERYKPCRLISCGNQNECEYNEASEAMCIDEDFNDKAFAFTGTLLSMTRTKAFEIVTKGGGQPQKSLNKRTDFLVVGIQDYTKLNGNTESSKMRKAYDLQQNGSPLKIIGEDEFVNMIDDELWRLCFN